MEGRVAIVTGASRGIGAAIAMRFAAAGAAVAVSARTEVESDDRLPGTIHETAGAISAAGGRAVAIRADLASAADRRRLVETAEAELGPVDVLVNNAAVTWFVPVADFPLRRFEVMFEVQVRAPFELAQLVLPGMRERGRGWILNISSGAARHPQGPPYGPRAGRGGTVYGMCKAAIERFSTGLAAEVYDAGIAVNALSPARVVATPGVVVHRLIPPGQEDQAEPVEVMADAAFALCTGDPRTLTGRVTYSQALLEELKA
ncbi:MAG: SDR family NAD(P)-dependent oxidoreductase [Chloroflexi bacterium]|nr:MAG: SDR family NAD(P)-dependent oxidoreductase [Chloroflexota bacterium]